MKRFIDSTRGAFSVIFVFMCIPILAAIALAVDVTNMMRQRGDVQTALDAAAVATAKIAPTLPRDELDAYARQMFDTNLHSLPASLVTMETQLNPPGKSGTLRLTSEFEYKPIMMGPIYHLIGGEAETDMHFVSDVQLTGKTEVALVIDNSWSMIFNGEGTHVERIKTVKKASKAAIDALATQEDVKVALVPFAGTVNIGNANRTASWIDSTGISPIHHENFDWLGSFPGDPATCTRCVEKVGNAWFARGTGWNSRQNKPLTRFDLFDAVGQQWKGCVEARPAPYHIGIQEANASQDAAGVISGDPSSLFVPMFAVDESGSTVDTNTWWKKKGTSGTNAQKQANVERYFSGTAGNPSAGKGPNYDCTTQPIIPLSDVTTAAGKSKLLTTVNAMVPDGKTNVGDAIAWARRVLSPGLPFDETESHKTAVRRYIIVLTDGANTYNASSNQAGTLSHYSVHGYVRPFDRTNENRLFQDTGLTPGTTAESFAKALNANMTKVCEAAKSDDIIVITIGLDLDMRKGEDAEQIRLLGGCASPDSLRADTAGTASTRAVDRPNPDKLFWNISSDKLEDVMKYVVRDMKSMYLSQ